MHFGAKKRTSREEYTKKSVEVASCCTCDAPAMAPNWSSSELLVVFVLVFLFVFPLRFTAVLVFACLLFDRTLREGVSRARAPKHRAADCS